MAGDVTSAKTEKEREREKAEVKKDLRVRREEEEGMAHPQASPGRSVARAEGAEMPAAKYASSFSFLLFFSFILFLSPFLPPLPSPYPESAPDLLAVAPSCRPQSPLK